MKRSLLIVLLITFLTGCTSTNDFNKGKKQLEQQGYTEIVTTGYSWLCCSKEDDYSTGFTAKNSKGEIIKGCFCSSIGKGITIRFR